MSVTPTSGTPDLTMLADRDPGERARVLLDRHLPDGIGVRAAGVTHPGSGEPIELRDPATGALVTTWADPGAEGAAVAVDAARRGAATWGAANPFERARILRDVAAAVSDNAEELAVLESATTGKPLRDTRVEAAKAAEMFAYFAGWADKIIGETIPVPGEWATYTRKVPWGVVVAVTPWNAPLFTAAWNAAPALATGNAVIVKPSEFTPVTSLRLAALAEDAGLPPGVLTVAPGLGGTLGAALTGDPRVGKIAFIGSVPTGRAVASAAAAVGTPTLLELGGKSANIVFDDADLDRAAHGAIAGIFAAAGQSCVAGSRLLVHRDIHDALIARIREGVRHLRLGDPLDPRTEIGPIVTRAQYDTVCSLIDTGMSDGADRVAGHELSPHLRESPWQCGNWVMPTVLDGVGPEHTLERTEVFGPVLSVGTFTDEAEAVARANGTGFGLAGAVWTADVSRAHRVAHAVDAGTFWINSYKTIHVAVPFGGVGDSGWGRSSGPGVLDEYTQTKAVWVPTVPTPPPFPSLT
ncbi:MULTISPECIES: aldehyde dehydrogenase family protein [Prauserella salsuginis group]|uniref:Aldehyde dehydrogenase family protein n=1 Tax=Prauserella salsuginis TaxID=387889 RepID=A0ABW6G094_9PSEU|nr:MULTISPECIES: aldehyde dehydrogenase family protein [Prauserella salsuginis group]MCR3721224.1 Acyl-CoA reductase [Prauserella flava]MCR3734695.1 Acyl-CoA reductase [Prauserella salsuginis]